MFIIIKYNSCQNINRRKYKRSWLEHRSIYYFTTYIYIYIILYWGNIIDLCNYHIYIYTHAHTHTHTHVCVHVCVYVCV